ncbi:hypothetical protein [Gordonia araii]|nr:hypothetical protein [Gordonia araii]NNG97105.1 hypothetical protein [Gordonia araii NBRC 100433]
MILNSLSLLLVGRGGGVCLGDQLGPEDSGYRRTRWAHDDAEAPAD